MVQRLRIEKSWLSRTGLAAWALCLCVYLAIPGQAATLREDESLRHLKGVAVAVEKINPDLEKLGLKRDQVKQEVEARLERAGIKLLTEKDVFTGKPWLYININAFEALEGRLLIFAISEELIQKVRLVRDPLISTTAVTWSASRAGYADRGQAGEINRVVGELVDRFIQDYSQANLP